MRRVKFTSVDYVGMVPNPMAYQGQIEGGVAQRIGFALMEELGYLAPPD